MTEKFVMSENNIPDGILLDQDLYNVSFKNNELILSFETHFYPQDYTDITFAEQYKDFTKCHIKCKIEDEMFCQICLETSVDKKNNSKCKYLSLKEFEQIANKEIKRRKEKGYWAWEYLNTSVSPGIKGAIIFLHIWLKHKRKTYTNCAIILDTNEIEFIWE